MTNINIPETIASTSIQIIENKQKSPFKIWTIQNPIELLKLAPLKLNGTDHMLIIYICSILDFDNMFAINQSTCAKELGVSRVSVNKSISTLEKHGIIQKREDSDSKSTTSQIGKFLLNPLYFYKGKSSKFNNLVTTYFNL